MLAKLISWIPKNLGAIIGIIQAVVKFVKEALTLVVDILLPIIPGDKFDDVVDKVREIVNSIDGVLEKIKEWLLSIGI